MLKSVWRWNLIGSQLLKDPVHISPKLGDIRLSFRIGSFVSELLQWILKTAPHTPGVEKKDKVVLVMVIIWPHIGYLEITVPNLKLKYLCAFSAYKDI